MPTTATETDMTKVFSQIWEQIRGSNLYGGQPRNSASEQGVSHARRAVELATDVGDARFLAEAWCMMAYALNANENYPEAIPYYRRAIDALEGLGEHHRAARIMLGFLSALSMNGHSNKAIEVGQRVQQILIQHGDDLGVARLCANMGTVYQRQDEHARALEHFIQATAYFERLSDERAVAQVCVNAGNSLLYLDRFEEAAQQFARTEEIATRLGLNGLWIQARYNRSYIHVLTGRYSDALESYRELRDVFFRHDSRRHAALCDMDECQIYLHLHLPQDAVLLAERAIEAFGGMEMSYEHAKSVACLGVALTQRRQFGDALIAFKSAQELFVKERNELWIAIIELYRAEVMFSVGRLWEAQTLASAAEERFERQNCGIKRIVSIVLLGRIALDFGRVDEAEAHIARVRELAGQTPVPLFQFACHALSGQIAESRRDFTEAMRHYELAAQEFDKRHTHLHHDELGITFFKGKQEIYEALVDFSLISGDLEGRERAFVWCEKAKSRTFVDLLAHHLPMIRSGADTALLDRVHRIREELNGSYLRFRPEMRAGGAGSPAKEVDLKETELIHALEDLSRTDAEYASLHEVAVPSLQAIQAVLPDHTAIVEYFVTDDEVLAFLIERNAFRICRHVSPISRVQFLAGRLNQQVRRLDEATGSAVPEAVQSRESMDRVLHQLYRELAAPVLEVLGTPEPDHIRRLIIVKHGALHLLPFHAFFDGERYLSERFHVSSAPSAAVLRFLLSRTESKHALAHQSIATRASFMNGVAARLVHIDAPVTLRQENPLLSSLEFSDSPLCTPDVYSLKCDAGVLALTGRQHRNDAAKSSDDLLGLVRGFFYAGADSVLTRLWNNPVAATSHFLEIFEKEWDETGSREEAMSRARMDLRKKFDHPFYWAPFSLWGRF